MCQWQSLNTHDSVVYPQQGHHCWISIQDSLHWTFSRVRQPQVRGVQRKMAERLSELRLRLSQVCCLSPNLCREVMRCLTCVTQIRGSCLDPRYGA